jgi:hypothetical protein
MWYNDFVPAMTLFPTGLFALSSLTEALYSNLISPIYARCPSHLANFVLITKITYVEKCKLWISSKRTKFIYGSDLISP